MLYAGDITFKEVKFLIQLPINFYPDGNTFDPSFESGLNDNRVRFTFKGDVLLTYHWKIYDYDTEELVTEDYRTNGSIDSLSPVAYNDTTLLVSNVFADRDDFPIDTQHRYVIQMLFTQGTSNSNLIFDHFVLRGELVNDYDSTTSLMVENKINLIYEWNIDENNIRRPVVIHQGSDALVGGIIIKIGNEQRNVVSYNYNTGEMVLDSPLTGTYEAGEPYQLYSNYKISQQYLFTTAPNYSFENLTAEWAGAEGNTNMFGVNFKADYNLTECNSLKYYTVSLAKQVGEDIVGEPRHYVKIYETKKIYSNEIRANFVDDYDVYNEYANLPVGNSQTRRYLFTVYGVLQNGMRIVSQLESVAPERNEWTPVSHLNVSYGNFDNYYNCVKLTWEHTTEEYFDLIGGIRIYRYDMDSDDLIISRKLLANVYATDDIFIDGTVSTHGNYKYVLIPFSRTGRDIGVCYTPLVTDTISLDMYGYTITELVGLESGIRYLNGKNAYKLGESWQLRAEIEDSTITQNTDRLLHVGYGKYSSVTHTATNYMSSTFEGLIVQPDCESDKKWRDDIALVKAWREFITKDCIYLLRSQKGDVWVVNIVESPTTTYEEKDKNLPTSVNFSWAECENVDDIIVALGAGW